MNEFTESEAGLFVPVDSSPNEEQRQLLVKAGWLVSLCDTYPMDSDVMQALETLYTAASKFGLPHHERRERIWSRLNEVAVEFLGGMPEEFEEWT